MFIEANSVVVLHFAVTDDQGEAIDDTRDAEPLEFLMGSGYLVPGLEAELEGLKAGDKFDVKIEPEQGYGIYDPELVQEVPAELFEGVEGVEPGMAFSAETDDGHRTVIVTAIEENTIVIDANHPFAGRTLQFDGEVIGIREATEEEIAHGHPHGAGGCGHDHGHEHSHDEGDSCCGGSGKEEGCCSSEESTEKKEGCCGGH